MSNTLKLVLTDHWFEEIKSGRKTHEYRKFTPYWENRLQKFEFSQGCFVQFQKALTFGISKLKLTHRRNKCQNMQSKT